jgi:hypothetical protein
LGLGQNTPPWWFKSDAKSSMVLLAVLTLGWAVVVMMNSRKYLKSL